MIRAALILAFLLSLPRSADVTTVILVRHAEALSDGSQDPGLSDSGKARAKALADAVRGAGVTAAIVTQYKRTKETAASLGVGVLEVPVERGNVAAHVEAVARKIREEHRGKTVVVVGHSNTIPRIVNALSGAEVTEIVHEEYDRFYTVVLQQGVPARVAESRYGAPGKTERPARGRPSG